MNTICNGELSDPLCDSVNRNLTLFRLFENLAHSLSDSEHPITLCEITSIKTDNIDGYIINKLIVEKASSLQPFKMKVYYVLMQRYTRKIIFFPQKYVII